MSQCSTRYKIDSAVARGIRNLMANCTELRVSLFVAILLTALACGRVALTYQHLSQVYDEPFHALRGMQWHSGNRYIHSEHPPLGPAVQAFFPYVTGVSFEDTGSKREDGNKILYSAENYIDRLMLFRSGNLLFLILGCWALFFYAWNLAQPSLGAFAVFFFTMSPPVLAHAGLATTDLPICVTLLIAIMAAGKAVTKPSYRKSAIAGLACGLAFTSKFSAFLFAPVSLIVVLTVRGIGAGGIPKFHIACRHVATMVVLCFAFIWLMYGFTVGRLGSVQIKEYSFSGFAPGFEGLQVPAPEFVAGIVWSKAKVEAGHGHYFFGKTEKRGNWAFFPAALAVKTPVLILLLDILGICACLSEYLKCGSSRCFEPIVIALAMLLCVLPFPVNIGVRHVLPIYPFLAVIAAKGFMCLLHYKWFHVRYCISLSIICYLVLDSLMVHPHYISYFNEIGRLYSKPILIDSDLDWGQGIIELKRACEKHNIRALRLFYFGTAEVERHGLPLSQETNLEPDWVAISLMRLYLDPNLREYTNRQPDAKIEGGSIVLYKVNASDSQSQSRNGK